MSLMTLVFHDFGQREHLFIVLATPFILVRLFRIQSGLINDRSSFLAIIGFFAGMGAALKPYFIVVILVGELALLLKSRKRSIWICPELFGFIFFGLLYTLFFACSPQIRTNYLEVLAPLISKGNSAYYASSSVIWNSFNPLINKHSAYLFLATLVFALNVLWIPVTIKKNIDLASGVLYLKVLSIMALISYLYQAKGWYYHMIPFEFLVVYVFVLNLCSLAIGLEGERTIQRSIVKMALPSVFLIHFALTAVFLWRMNDQGRYWNSQFFEILQNTPVENNRVLMVSSSLTAYPFLLQADKRPGSRFLWLFPIALLYSQSHDSSLSESEIFANGSIDNDLEARFIQELVNDIQSNRPALIFMNSSKSDQGLPKNFTLKNYLRLKKVSDLIEQYYCLDSQSFYTNDGAFYELWVLKN